MALVKNTNSYLTVEEADSFFLDNKISEDWIDQDAILKAQALVTATSILDDRSWIGVAVDASQPLAFPRTGFYFDPKMGMEVNMNVVPKRVLTALCLLADHIAKNDLFAATDTVDSITVGPISLNTIKTKSTQPPSFIMTIQPMLAHGRNAWWRAN